MGLLKLEVPAADPALFNVGALSADLRNLIRKLELSDLDVPALVREANDTLCTVRTAAKSVQTTALQVGNAALDHGRAARSVGTLADIVTAILLGLVVGAGIKGVVRAIGNMSVWPVS